MAPPLVVANCVQVRIAYTQSDEVCFNVLNFIASGAVVVGQTLADAIGTDIRAAFTAEWAPKCGPNFALHRTGVRDLRAANLPEFQDSGTPVTGSAIYQNNTHASAVCVTLRTDKAGKSFRGRVYLPGADANENTSAGEQTAALGLAAAAFVNSIATKLQPRNLNLGVLSRPSDEVIITETTNHTGGGTATRVLSHQTAKVGEINAVRLVEARNNRWEYQRRRDNGRGLGVSSLRSVAQFSITPA